MKRFCCIFILILVLAGATLFGALFLRSQPTVSVNGGTPISVMIADTGALREKGLSGHPGLAENEGMLFIFDTPDRFSFWMKDMNFPIDIIWIGQDWTVVDVTHNLAPESFPESVSPQGNAQYVLEVPAGFAQAHDVRLGQSVRFQK